jgi:hypothetical protein
MHRETRLGGRLTPAKDTRLLRAGAFSGTVPAETFGHRGVVALPSDVERWWDARPPVCTVLGGTIHEHFCGQPGF